MPFKRLILTDFKCEMTRLAKKKELSAALEESGLQPFIIQAAGMSCHHSPRYLHEECSPAQ